MSTMFKAGDFFVRLRIQSDRPKLTVWNNKGTKIVSEFVGAATADFWTKIAELTSQDVVDQVQALLQTEM